MGLGDLFKGYVFFKLVSLGITFTFLGIFLTGWLVLEQEFFFFICSIPTLLVGVGALFFAKKIWSGEKEGSSSTSSSAEIGYSKENMMTCPECGEEKMEVALDGSGVCKNCGHSTKEYYEEVEEGSLEE